MGEWWKILLSLTVSGTALAVLTAGLIRLLRGRVPCRWLCGLWLLVLLRFLCPLGTQFGLIPGMMASPAVPVLVVDLAEEGAQGEAGIPPQQPSVPSGGNPGHVPLSLAAAAVWGAGAAAVLAVRLLACRRLRRTLEEGQLPLQPWELALFQELTAGRRRLPRLMRSAAAGGPMLSGTLRPVIWLPADPIPEPELRYALIHELTHWRRRDVPLKWLTTAAAALHWFNPAVWLAARAVERDCELACDEAAVSGLDQGQRRKYGEMLLQAAAGPVRRRQGALSATLWSEKQCLKERLYVVMKPALNNKKAKYLLTGAVLAVLLTSAALGGYAGAAEESNAQPDSGSAAAVQTAEELSWPFAEQDEVTLSRLFGIRVHPVTGRTIQNDGIGIVLEEGTPVLAAAAGQVLETGYGNQGGNYVLLDHVGGMTTRYCHLKEVQVEAGQQVQAGDQLGLVGATGMATGPHLYFEVAVDGTLTDPLELLPESELVFNTQGRGQGQGAGRGMMAGPAWKEQ